MSFATEYISFPTRESRSKYLAARFSNYLETTVLDVGCFEAPLRQILTAASYTGVDMVGDPDVQLNLEQAEALPFDAESFDTVLCIDVLEHLDNLHAMFAELVRVAKRHIIVALPNCWCDARRPIERGKGKFGHYGLPLDKPVDRHKWFFGMTEARDFLTGKARSLDLEVAALFVTEKPRFAPFRLLRKIRYPGETYNNRYSRTLWTVLRKPGA